MEEAIDNMIAEIRKPVDPEINGSARKAELQSIKQTAIDCKELLVERQRLEQMTNQVTRDTASVRFCNTLWFRRRGSQNFMLKEGT